MLTQYCSQAQKDFNQHTKKMVKETPKKTVPVTKRLEEPADVLENLPHELFHAGNHYDDDLNMDRIYRKKLTVITSMR